MNNIVNIPAHPSRAWHLAKPNAQAKIRLFCFPFAGGSAFYFKDWAEELPDDVELIILQAPGRAERIKEQPYTSMAELIQELMQDTSIYSEKPAIFFGHSMGAWVAAELCWQLQKQGINAPLHFIISGSLPLCFSRFPPYVHQMDDDDLTAELRVLGGTPEDILNDRAFMQHFFPAIRGDFQIFETHRNQHHNTLHVDISIWAGLDDPRVPASLTHCWDLISSGAISERFFAGGHMFIDRDQSRAECLAELNRVIASAKGNLNPKDGEFKSAGEAQAASEEKMSREVKNVA